MECAPLNAKDEHERVCSRHGQATLLLQLGSLHSHSSSCDVLYICTVPGQTSCFHAFTPHGFVECLYGLACAQGLKGDGHRNLVIFSTMVKNAEVLERQRMILTHTSTEKLKRQSQYLWSSHCWLARNLSLQVDLETLQRRIPKGGDSGGGRDMEGTTGSTPSKRANERRSRRGAQLLSRINWCT